MAQILVIDEDQSTGVLLKNALSEQGYVVHIAATASEGLAASLEHTPSLILLSNTLPDQPGMDVFTILRSRARTIYIPVMFLASRGDAKQQNAILQAGADDFITKPFDIDILSLRIRNMIKHTERDGLQHPQTGLPTGRLLQERVRNLADEYGWYKIDFEIDGFANFREVYGFMTGQEVLNYAAGLLSSMVQAHGTADDFIGHRADAEFMVITRLEKGDALRDALQKEFDEGVLSFYNYMEREQGYIDIADSSGGHTHAPLMHAKIKTQQGEAE